MSSLMSLSNTLFHYYWNARQSIVASGDLAQEVKGNVEDTAAMEVWALRPKKRTGTKKKKKHCVSSKWINIHAADLLPGDVFVLGLIPSNTHDLVMPVDALLLEGDCIANEAVLAGEIVPQSKKLIDVDLSGDAADSSLDIMTLHRNT
eukprot:5682173-Ditylum_brightwellii.AAC.1